MSDHKNNTSTITAGQNAVRGSEATPLGTNAESFTPLSEKPSSRAEARAQRFELQAVARDLLRRRGAALGHAYAANYHKTAKCLYTPFDSQVHVYRSQRHGNAFYGGLVVCAKPGCPVCATKVSERRRVEIAHAFDWAYNNGKKVVMLTFTHPHRAWDSLSDQLKRQSQAFAKLRAGNPWKRILPDGYLGLIRSLEVTYGRNGWHPHLHEAWIVDKDADVSGLRRKVLKRWLKMLCRVGMVTLPPVGDGKRFAALRAFYRHSVDVMDNVSTSDYLAKHDEASKGAWGADREIAKASSKRGRAAGRTPFQLLADCRDGDEKAGRLYVDYVEAIKGRPPVFWSQGLKALVGVDELNDQQIAERHDDKADVLGMLELDDWRMVRQAGYRAHLLQVAEEGGWPAVQVLLKFLEEKSRDKVENGISRVYTKDIRGDNQYDGNSDEEERCSITHKDAGRFKGRFSDRVRAERHDRRERSKANDTGIHQQFLKGRLNPYSGCTLDDAGI